MIIYDKEFEELNEEDRLKISLMKTLALAKGYTLNDLKHPVQSFDFRSDTNFALYAQKILDTFSLSQKSKEIEDLSLYFKSVAVIDKEVKKSKKSASQEGEDD